MQSTSTMRAFHRRIHCFLTFALLFADLASAVYDFVADFGAIPDDDSYEACLENTRLLNDLFQKIIRRRETLRIASDNQTIYFHPGIVSRGLENVHLIVDGNLRFERLSNASIPTDIARPDPCWLISDSTNVTWSTTFSLNETVSRNRRGLIDGQGSQYWGVPYIGYLQLKDHRPTLVHIQNSSHVILQRLVLKDCPIECLFLDRVNHVRVRNSSIVSRRTARHTHSFVDLSAFGTKGILIKASKDINVQSVDIWTQDECVRVDDDSAKVSLEGINASGLGFSIASSNGRVSDVSIRNSRLYRSMKGLILSIYKGTDSESSAGQIENVHVENLTMESIVQWPLWFGPAQLATQDFACEGNPCSVCWPQWSNASCNLVPNSRINNITLRNLQINNPRLANGVFLSDGQDSVLDNILFENVRVTKGEQLAYATKDLVKTFPGLKQSLRDFYVTNDEGLLGAHLIDYRRNEPLIGLEDYHSSRPPPEGLMGMTLLARVGVIVGTLLCAFSMVLLLILCIRLQCREVEDIDDIAVLRPAHNTGLEEGSDHQFVNELLLEPNSTTSGDGALKSPGESTLEDPLLPQNPNESIQNSYESRKPRLSRLSRSCQIAPYHIIALLAAIYGLIVGLSWLIEVPSKPEWERIDRYYMCQGVTHGIARGSTWPVPYCFADETEFFSWTQVYDHLSGFLRSHFVLAAGLLSCFSLYIHFSFLFKERTARNALASLGDDIMI